MRNPRFLIGLFLRVLRWNPCSDIADLVLGDSSIQCLKSWSNANELSSGSQAFPSLNGNVKGGAYVGLLPPARVERDPLGSSSEAEGPFTGIIAPVSPVRRPARCRHLAGACSGLGTRWRRGEEASKRLMAQKYAQLPRRLDPRSQVCRARGTKVAIITRNGFILSPGASSSLRRSRAVLHHPQPNMNALNPTPGGRAKIEGDNLDGIDASTRVKSEDRVATRRSIGFLREPG
jgi:hypothetical protein